MESKDVDIKESVGDSIIHGEYVPFSSWDHSVCHDLLFDKTVSLKSKLGFNNHFRVTDYVPGGVIIQNKDNCLQVGYSDLLKDYVFADGSPCGVKVSPTCHGVLEQGEEHVEFWNKYIEYLDCYHKNDVCMPKVKNSGVISPGHKYGDSEEKSFEDKKEIEMAKIWIESLSPEVFRFVMLKYLYRGRSYGVVDIYRLENFINE